MDTIKLLFELQARIQQMQFITGDATLGTRVKKGMIQVVSVTYRGTKSKITELSSWHPVGNFQLALDEAMVAKDYSATRP